VADIEKPPESGKPDDAEKPVEKGNPVKAPKAPKPAKKDDVRLPVLVEFTALVSIFIIVLAFFTVAGVSILTGATLLDFVIHTSVTLLVIGIPVIFLSRQITFGLEVADVVTEEKPEETAQPEAEQSSPSPTLPAQNAIPGEMPNPSEVK